MNSLGMYRKVGPATVRITLRDAWIGCGRYLIGIRDHRYIPPLFSERYRGQHGISKGHYWHVGPICFHLDTNWMNRRINKGDADE